MDGAANTPANTPANTLPDARILAEAWEDPLVVDARANLDAALPSLRFHEGLRRRWREARAETAVREAWALAHSEGVRIGREELRSLTAPDAEPSGLPAGRALALGIWRAQWDVTTRMPDLNLSGHAPSATRSTAPAFAAALHRDVCSALVAAGHLGSSGVGMPASEAPSSMNVIGLADNATLPALLCAAVIEAEFATRDIFTPGSAPVGAALARYVLVRRGFEPTGVAMTAAGIRADEAAYRLALARYSRGDVGGVADWFAHVASGILRGVVLGRDVALEIQAARLAGGL